MDKKLLILAATLLFAMYTHSARAVSFDRLSENSEPLLDSQGKNFYLKERSEFHASYQKYRELESVSSAFDHPLGLTEEGKIRPHRKTLGSILPRGSLCDASKVIVYDFDDTLTNGTGFSTWRNFQSNAVDISGAVAEKCFEGKENRVIVESLRNNIQDGFCTAIATNNSESKLVRDFLKFFLSERYKEVMIVHRKSGAHNNRDGKNTHLKKIYKYFNKEEAGLVKSMYLVDDLDKNLEKLVDLPFRDLVIKINPKVEESIKRLLEI